MYRFANGISPYISYSEAFVPNLGTDGSGGYLKPTTGKQEEAGLKYLAPTGNTSVAFAWFNIQQQNRVSTGATPGGLEQVGAEINGWEISANQRWGALEVMGNYSDMSAINPTTQQRLSSVAEKAASVWAQYHFAGGWRAGVGSRYTGNVTGNLGLPVAPSVTQYDAMLGYTIGKWDWRLNVQNLTDEEYVSWCRGPATLTSTVLRDCGYGARRNVLLTANYKF
jgi:iron complex outermembrane receptor protein